MCNYKNRIDNFMLQTLIFPSSRRLLCVPPRHKSCGILLASTLFLLFAIGTANGAATPVPLSVRVANTTVPAGGTAQIQIFLTTPAAIVNGEMILDLDPKVFGPIQSADVFSATGDQIGSATIKDEHLDVVFQSATGGIGRLPDLPVLVLSVPVPLSVPDGTTSSITFQSGSTKSNSTGAGPSPP